MQSAEHLQDTFNMGFDNTLEHAFVMRRFFNRGKLAVLAKKAASSMDDCTSDSSMEPNHNNSSDSENADTTIDLYWNINEQMDDENVSDDARTNRGLGIVMYLMRCDMALAS